MQATATEVGRDTNPSQAANEILTPSYKWFSLQDNRLDGSYHPLPADGSGQVGWWGTSLSDASGYLSASPTLTIAVDGARPVHTLRVAGDSLLNEYPVDFVIRLYNDITLLHTEAVTGNTQVVWVRGLSQTFDVTKIELVATRVNKPGRTVKVLEALNPFEIYRGDALEPRLDTAVVSLTRPLSSVDALKAAAIGVAAPVEAQVPGVDSLAVSLADSSFFWLYEFLRKDTLKPVFDETARPVLVNCAAQDNLNIKVIESIADFVVNLAKAAELVVSRDIEAREITVDLPLRTDELGVAFAGDGDLTNIHSVMNAPRRRTYGRVQITYSDPFLDVTITATASGTAHGTDAYGTANNLKTSAHKWLSLHENTLDGSYHPLPMEPAVGWWSDVLSDASGVFVEPPTLTVSFEPRSVHELQVIGDDKLDSYPVDFAINLYDANDTLLYSEVATGNERVNWTEGIELVSNVAKMELVILRINKPYSAAKIVEFYTAVQEVYEGRDLLSINLLEEQESTGGTLPIGNISSNEIRIRLNNEDRHFDPANEQSPIHNRLKRNRRIRAWLGAEVVPGEIEWYSLGEFWTLDWRVPEQEYYAETTGRDRLELMRQTEFVSSEVYQSHSLYQLAEIILRDYGLAPDKYVIDPALEEIVIPYAWFSRVTHREALRQIAMAALARVYTDRQGRVVIRVFDTAVKPLFEFDGHNIFNKDQPLAWGKTVNHVEVKTSPLQPGPLVNVVHETEGFSLAAGAELKQTYTFSMTPVIDVMAPEIASEGSVVVKDYTAYAWGVDIVFENVGATDGTVTSVIVKGKRLEPGGGRIAVARDEMSVIEHGVQKLTVENEFIQTAERAQAIADALLAVFKDPGHDLILDARGNIALQLGDMVTAWGDEYFLVRQELDWDGSLGARIKARKAGDN